MALCNALLVRYQTGYVWVVDDDSVGDFDRREGYLTLGAVASRDEAARVGAAVLAGAAEPSVAVSVGVEPAGGDVPYSDFHVGDWVTVPTLSGAPSLRVKSLTVTEDGEGNPIYTPELGTMRDEQDRLVARWLKRMSNGTLGGTVESATPPLPPRVKGEVVGAPSEAGSAHDHAGSGEFSTVVRNPALDGVDSDDGFPDAPGPGAVSVGFAVASGTAATAIGPLRAEYGPAVASGPHAVAAGAGARATENEAVAIGSPATATAEGALALLGEASGVAAVAAGLAAIAAHAHASAWGPDAVTDDDNQCMLGTAADQVVVPGTLKLPLAPVDGGVLVGDASGVASWSTDIFDAISDAFTDLLASVGDLFTQVTAITALTLASGKGFVNHGATAATARPPEFASVEWYGSVEPDNAIAGDTWVDTS